jgi:hypothetical protein
MSYRLNYLLYGSNLKFLKYIIEILNVLINIITLNTPYP